MDVQAEINWIISELHHVKDPHLIEAFKNMLKYRNKQNDPEAIDPALGEVLTNRAKRAEDDIREGRVYSPEQVKERLSNRFSK